MTPITLTMLLPVITTLGFAMQQFLQVIVDPLVSMAISILKARQSVKPDGTQAAGKPLQPVVRLAQPVNSDGTQVLPWGLSEEDLKRALLGIVSIILGLLIAIFATDLRVLTAAKNTLQSPMEISKGWDLFITALLISVGAEGANSVTKFAQYVKDVVKAKNPLSGTQNPFLSPLPVHPHSPQSSANPLLPHRPVNPLSPSGSAANFNSLRLIDVATSERLLDLQARAKEEEYDA